MATESRVPRGDMAWLRYFRANFTRLVDNVGRGASYTQTYATADRTHAARVAAAVVTSPSTSSTPFGWATASQADAIITQLNNLRTDQLDTAGVVNALIDDLQAFGLVP